MSERLATWLCPREHHRERFFDMQRRMRASSLLLSVSMWVLLVPGALMSYPLPVAVLVLTTSTVGIALQRVCLAARRPEVVYFASVLIVQSGFLASFALAHRLDRADVGLFLWPTVVAYSRFPTRVGNTFAIATGLLFVALQALFDRAAVLDQPLVVTLPLAALAAVSLFSAASRSSDAASRREAVLDELTGLLNRTALHTRTGELEQRSAIAGAPVGVLVGDLDHFKAINDRHGHAVGDEVLREVARRVRATVGPAGATYRLGGEELAVLLPGADPVETQRIAEAARCAVAGAPIAGVPVTLSFGVATSPGDRPFGWAETFRAADQALYRAKAAGRDRVVVATEAVAA